jgi:hypothetical protein
MEIQLKKGLLEIIVLSTLINNDSYGYKIIQEVSGIINVSESTLYPILRRLERAGYGIINPTSCLPILTFCFTAPIFYFVYDLFYSQ